jgi:hypothetical protein
VIDIELAVDVIAIIGAFRNSRFKIELSLRNSDLNFLPQEITDTRQQQY